MPGRSLTPTTQYRYGFNGKEKDPSITSDDYDYGFRIYDARIGRFLSVDPLIKKFPWYTPYEYAGNKPIQFVDLEGLQTPEDDGEEVDKDETLEELARVRRAREERENEEELAKSRKAFEEIVGKPPLERYREFALRGIHNYGANAFSSMQSVFGGNVSFTPYPPRAIDEQLIRYNKATGQLWEKEVTAYLKTNPNYRTVVNQVTLIVSGTVNGQLLSAKIRIDNVAVNRYDGSVELFDAKYSVQELTINNVTQTLTGKQAGAFDIFVNGENINVVFRGGVVKSNDLKFYSGQNITGKIKSVSLITPQLQSNSNNANNNSTNSAPNPNDNKPKL